MKECLEWYILLKIVFFLLWLDVKVLHIFSNVISKRCWVDSTKWRYLTNIWFKINICWHFSFENYIIVIQECRWKGTAGLFTRINWEIQGDLVKLTQERTETEIKVAQNHHIQNELIKLKEHLVIDTNVSCKVTSAHIWEGLDSNKWGEFRHWRNMQHKYKCKCR